MTLRETLSNTQEIHASPEKPVNATFENNIPTNKQEYIDLDKQYAHNVLYAPGTLEVIGVKNGKALVRDNTGDFWVPLSYLNFE